MKIENLLTYELIEKHQIEIGTAHTFQGDERDIIIFSISYSKNGKTYNFYWGKSEQRAANLIAQRNGVYVRFKWEDEEQHNFFEMRITYNELVMQHMLEITDFAEKDEIDDLKNLWDSQIEQLRRHTGM